MRPYSFPSIPDSLNDLLKLHKDFSALGVPSELLTHPKNFTEMGHSLLREAGVLKMQEMQNNLQNSIMDLMRITIDPYMPETVRRQVRFPRSKKKRIRKKWAKDPRNFKMFRPVFMVNPDSFKLRIPDLIPLVRAGAMSTNAAMYFPME